jgi:hypothetical protein
VTLTTMIDPDGGVNDAVTSDVLASVSLNTDAGETPLRARTTTAPR